MHIVDIIAKKRDGQELSQTEIEWFVDGFVKGTIPDYQLAAWLMAICIRGMSAEEVSALTLAMAHSGDMLDLSDVSGYVVDKHSSGGVGDKTSLVVLPLVASCGVPVAKMSGRGLGYTGGTLDKLEAIAGFQVSLQEDVFLQQANDIGLAIAGQSRDLAPADGIMYALRDVTATVKSIPLIASSIMSKKLAAGANGIVLDVKVGSGAFMTDFEEARLLAQTMVNIGDNAGRDVVAVISDMNQPLGSAVGHSLEVAEAIEALQGGGPVDLRQHVLKIAAHMLRLYGRGERWTIIDETSEELAAKLDDGSALAIFRMLVEAQGGDGQYVDQPDLLPQAPIVETIQANGMGYVVQVAADKVARAVFALGGGRLVKEDPIDLAVGIQVHVKVGDYVDAYDPLYTIHANDADKLTDCLDIMQDAVRIEAESKGALPLFYDVMGHD